MIPRRQSFTFLALLSSLLFLPGSLRAEGSAAPASPFHLKLEPAETTVGEKVKVTLLCDDPSMLSGRIQSVRFDRDTTATANWDIDSDWARNWNAQPDGKPGLWGATVRPFELGQVKLPVTIVDFQTTAGRRAEARLTSATLAVKSIRPPGAQGVDLIGLHDLAKPPDFIDWDLWGSIAAGVALLALIVWMIARRRNRPKVPEEPPLPPGLWAMRELERLSRLPVCQTGPAKTIYSMVSETMRIYIARRYAVPAIDMTTRECIQALHGARVEASALQWIEQFLNECDLVKFSRCEMPRERWATIWNDAKTIVQRTTPAHESGEGASAAAPPSSGRPVPEAAS